MTRNAAGGVVAPERALLDYDWHKQLTESQLAAYVRYQFIYLNEHAVDWDSRAHSVRRPSWDGGKNNYGVKYTSVWGKAVHAILEANAHPGMWVHSQFSPAADRKFIAATNSIPEVRPSMMYAAAAECVYIKYMDELPLMLESGFNIAGQTISSRYASTKSYNLAKDDQALYVLCDESYVSASSFFRYVFSSLAQCDRAIERYLWFAALDYEVHQVVYNQLALENNTTDWWITDELKAAVCAIREHWRNYNG